MRVLLGLLVLGSLFVMAATWQRSHTEELRAQRSRRFGLPPAGQGLEEGWSTLVLGRRTGAEALPVPTGAGPDGGPETVEDAPGPGQEQRPTYEPDFRYEVQSGDVLGVICQRHYDPPIARLVEAVARYNDLGDPDDIRAGQILLLPDRALLGVD